MTPQDWVTLAALCVLALCSSRTMAARWPRWMPWRLDELGAIAALVGRLTPATGSVAAEWTVRYPKGVSWIHGDAANAQPTTKALLDSLVPRWLPGDGPRHVVAETFRRGPNLDRPGDHEIALVLTPQE